MAKFDIKISEAKKDNTVHTVVTISGDLSLNNTEEIKEKVAPHIDANDKLIIKTEEVNNIDLSMLQMFYAIKNTATEKNKTVSFDINIPDESLQIIQNAGLGKFEQLNVN